MFTIANVIIRTYINVRKSQSQYSNNMGNKYIVPIAQYGYWIYGFQSYLDWAFPRLNTISTASQEYQLASQM